MTINASKNIHLQRGKRGEELGAAFLQQRGLRIVSCNYHCRYGEIDIVAQDGNVLVFVEVRTRKEHAQVTAAESINSSKIAKWQRSAAHYLQQHFAEPPDCRFDALCITSCKNGDKIDWLRGLQF